MELKKLVLISLLAIILFVQEQALMFLPNVSLTILLIMLYAKMFRLKDSLLIIIIYVFLDNLYYGGINLYYFPFTVLAWSLVVILTKTINTNNEFALAAIAFINAIIYSMIVMIPALILTEVSFKVYYLADLPFQLILGLSSLITVIFLFKPLYNRLQTTNLMNIMK